MRTIGEEVKQYLIKQGVETPIKPNKYDSFKKKEVIAKHFKIIMETLELDLSDDSLIGTPDRVAKMYVDEVFYGLDYSKFPKCTTVDNKMKYDEMVTVSGISVQSNCEHHFVVIDGIADVAYIPAGKVLGLSKINRIVEFFSKRPQIQERLTEQIYFALQYILGTDNIAVRIKATHYCVKSRGVRDINSQTTTTKLGGSFLSSELRTEFFSQLK